MGPRKFPLPRPVVAPPDAVGGLTHSSGSQAPPLAPGPAFSRTHPAPPPLRRACSLARVAVWHALVRPRSRSRSSSGSRRRARTHARPSEAANVTLPRFFRAGALAFFLLELPEHLEDAWWSPRSWAEVRVVAHVTYDGVKASI